MSEPDPIDLSKLLNLQFGPSWADELAKADASSGEVIWGKVPGGGRDSEDRPRHGGRPGREGGRGFDRGDRGPRPERRGPRPDFRGGPPGQGQGDRRPPRGDGGGPPRGERRDGPPGPPRDRDQRGPRPERREFGGRRDDRGPQGQGRPPFRGGERRDFRDEQPPLQGWPVRLVPDPRQVEAISRQIKASGRAFSVFDVGRLFMQSRDRFQVRFTRQESAPAKAKEGAPAPAPAPRGPETILQCAADGSLWLTRDEAIRHILNSPAIEKYYRRETVTVDAPKGNWNSVAVCGFSGALLGPPNHHDFQRNVARIHRERFSDMSLERYKSRIRTEKDEALLQKWQESQSTAVQFVPVSEEPLPEGAEPPAPLKSVSEMEAHFLRTHAATAVNNVTTATVPGNIPGRNLSPALLQLLRREVENQQRFPMQLVQDLCRELESQGLRFFKRDRKATFVCRNRPHFLPDDLVLSDRIRAMVEMVRANPGITYSRLVSTLAPHIVRIEPAPAAPAAEAAPVETPATPAAESETPVAETAPAAVPVEPAAEITDAPPADEAVPAVPAESSEPSADEAAPAADPTSEGSTETTVEGEPAAEPVADAALAAPAEPAPPAAPAPPPAPHLSPEEIAILQDLHWLVQEGYVTEFQNGELFVLGRPPQPPVEKKPKPRREQKPASGEPGATVESATEGEAASEAAPEDSSAATSEPDVIAAADEVDTPAPPTLEESPSAPNETEPPDEPAVAPES